MTDLGKSVRVGPAEPTMLGTSAKSGELQLAMTDRKPSTSSRRTSPPPGFAAPVEVKRVAPPGFTRPAFSPGGDWKKAPLVFTKLGICTEPSGHQPAIMSPIHWIHVGPLLLPPLIVPEKIYGFLQLPEMLAVEVERAGLAASTGLIMLMRTVPEYKEGYVRLKVRVHRAMRDGIIFTQDGDTMITCGQAGCLPPKYIAYLNEIRPLGSPHSSHGSSRVTSGRGTA